MGVWIETAVFDINPQVNQVTPCMGVWIETYCSFIVFFAITRHTLYGCVD